jgi:uncharacterized integral membrane protein
VAAADDLDLEIEDDDLDLDFRDDVFAPKRQSAAVRLFVGPALNTVLRWFGIVVLVLLVGSLLIHNWPPVRLHFVFWAWDIPGVILYVLFAALGAVLHWLWSRSRRAPSAEPESADVLDEGLAEDE